MVCLYYPAGQKNTEKDMSLVSKSPTAPTQSTQLEIRGVFKGAFNGLHPFVCFPKGLQKEHKKIK